MVQCGFFYRYLVLASVILAGGHVSLGAESTVPVEIKTLIDNRCVKCHGPDKPNGDVRLDTLPDTVAQDRSRWAAVRDQLRDGLMPPEDEARLPPAELSVLMEWLTTQLGEEVASLPNGGNLLSHDLLFGKPATESGSTPARLWRLSPDGYNGFIRDVHCERTDGLVQPFTLIPERGIKDFAGLYVIDEASTEILLRNAEWIVESQSAHELKDGKVHGKNDTVGEFVKLMAPAREPTIDELKGAVQKQFRMAIGRPADDSEVERFLHLYNKCAAAGDRPAAIKTMLQAVLLRADAMYRMELGGNGAGRQMLAAPEIVRAIGLVLVDRRESGLVQAGEKGELTSREQVAEHVRRILDDTKIQKPGIQRFFREYFEYHRATEVFKDKPTDRIKHLPQILVSDTDRLIMHLVEADQNVLRELLTTRRAFVNYNTKVDKSKSGRPLVGVPADVIPPNNRPDQPPEWIGGVDTLYGFDAWPTEQPTELRPDTRQGILMQPSWLVAFSTNFDNDPVRRGRWIRERLLGGTVPDLPIGVVAQIPDERHRTLRDRARVTREAQCWKCHQYMDELGLPFENFDHYGRFRKSELVLDLAATEMNIDKSGKPLGQVQQEAELNTTGVVAHTGEAQLDGPVSDPRALMTRLAGSERVRQVFIRHLFRYCLGRNESLADARTLQAADLAYVESGGSFKTLLVSLLTSDSFLYRTGSASSELSTREQP